MTNDPAVVTLLELRLLTLLQQTTVLSDYRARIGDDFLSADTLFHDAKPGEPPIVIPLHQALYEQYYCRIEQQESAEHSPGSASEPFNTSMPPAEFLELLRSANSGRQISRSDWKLYSLTPNGQAFVTVGETIHLSEPGDFSLRQLEDGSSPELESVIFRTERTSQEIGRAHV